MDKKEHPVFIFLRFLLKEFMTPLNYVIAFFIGLVINFFQGIGVFASFVPFIVPVIVQSISKASVKFSNRNINTLVKLPIEKKDPAFVMNVDGEIIAAEGLTKKLFNENHIRTFYDFVDNEKKEIVDQLITASCKTFKHEVDEFCADKLGKWYNVNIKADEESKNLLVWLEDVTLRKNLDEKIQKIRSFLKQTMLGIDEQLKSAVGYDRLAEFVLAEGYHGVFITNIDHQGNLKGYVFKRDDNEKIEKSDQIIISRDSDAPIWESRKNKGMVTSSRKLFKNEEKFDEKFKFDKRVLSFLNFNIHNFVNFHEEDISFIAFNKENDITPYDLSFMEAIVNSAFTVNYLISLIKKQQELR